MTNKNSVGSILRRLREDKRQKWIERDQWTQTAVARRIGVSRVTYIAWENDEWLPGVDHLKRIIAIFRLNEQDEAALYRTVAQLPPEKVKLPPRNTFFTGRNDYLDELHRKLQEGGSVAITQAVGISGLGGIGKTQIALEYAYHHHPKVYRTALWVNAADRATLQADYDTIAYLLNLPELDEQKPELRVEAVKRWLDDHTRWLLVMDNADDLQLVRSFMPGRPLGHIILTTRSQAIREGNIAMQLVVEEMKQQEALVFLLRRAGLWDEEAKLGDEAKLNMIATDIRDRAAELVTLLGRHPLGLDQAGAYIEASGISLADYIQLYREERQSLLDARGPPGGSPGDHPETVTVTVQLSVKKACERDAKAADVLSFCSFLQPDAMPEEVFYQDGEMRLTLRSFNDIMAALRRYSLVDRNAQEKLLSMHRLIQAVLIDAMSSDLQKQWRARVACALSAAFPEVEFKNWEQCGRLLTHALTCARWTEDELPMTQEVAELLTKAAVYSQEQGKSTEGDLILLRVLKFWDKQLGVDHPTTGAAAHRLAQYLKKGGTYDTAKKYYWWTLIAYEKHLGIGHPAMAAALSELGTLYVSQRKYKNAITLISLAIIIQKRRLGDSHPAILRSLRDLATVYRYQGKYDIAIRVYKEARSTSEKSLGINHPDTLSIVRELGMTYVLKGEYELAEPLLTQSANFCAQYLGVDHPDMAKSLICIAWLYYKQGKYKQSSDLYQLLLASRERRSRMDPLDFAQGCYGWALAQQQQKQYDRAEKFYRRAIQIYERKVGGTAAYAPDLKKNYAALLRDMQRYTEAAALELNDEPPYDLGKDEVDKDVNRYFNLLGVAYQHSQSPFGS
ncbi:MAG TPA: FxSxx-COOH system tetratricopeptide repeat protein [Ktedonobacteraceae bacterium]|nr:FxSxx-COOH system tetratricopeptide repeat protein [Ktedonobacteraceae bacterium]